MAATGFTHTYEVIGAGGRRFKMQLVYNCLRDSDEDIDLGPNFPIPPPKPGAVQLDRKGKGTAQDVANQWVRAGGVVSIG